MLEEEIESDASKFSREGTKDMLHLWEHMIEAVKEITIGGMATLALLANVSICLIVIALLWFLIKVLKNGGGLKQAPQLLQFVVLWICGAAHTSFCNCQI